jgi:glycosyltransferase involved in cell wall biosynthesis
MESISVIVPSFNARLWIVDTLNSVQSQSVPSLEVIVVDDGSTDGTSELLAVEFPSVRVVRTANLGPSRARNLGTSLSTGAFLQYLDADDILLPHKIRHQVDALDRSGADVAYGGWQELNVQADGSTVLGRLVEREIQKRAEIALITDFWCPPAAYLFRRRIVDKVGAWNERLPIIQDARFVLDCALHGGQFVYCPGVAALYRVHSAGSVSTRDPIAFVRDCLTNAQEVEQWWRERDGLDGERQNALQMVYQYTARASFERDKTTFVAACQRLAHLNPHYVPAGPWHFALAARFLGYPRAEALAWNYRKLKRVWSKWTANVARLGSPPPVK